MNAVHYGLGNLVAIVDFNGLEADGTLQEITAIGNVADKYRSFGWNVREFDGNSVEEIKCQFDSLPAPDASIPTVFICRTIKGKGVPFMENQVKWHAGKITDKQYTEGVRRLTEDYKKRWGVWNE